MEGKFAHHFGSAIPLRLGLRRTKSHYNTYRARIAGKYNEHNGKTVYSIQQSVTGQQLLRNVEGFWEQCVRKIADNTTGLFKRLFRQHISGRHYTCSKACLSMVVFVSLVRCILLGREVPPMIYKLWDLHLHVHYYFYYMQWNWTAGRAVFCGSCKVHAGNTAAKTQNVSAFLALLIDVSSKLARMQAAQILVDLTMHVASSESSPRPVLLLSLQLPPSGGS